MRVAELLADQGAPRSGRSSVDRRLGRNPSPRLRDERPSRPRGSTTSCRGAVCASRRTVAALFRRSWLDDYLEGRQALTMAGAKLQKTRWPGIYRRGERYAYEWTDAQGSADAEAPGRSRKRAPPSPSASTRPATGADPTRAAGARRVRPSGSSATTAADAAASARTPAASTAATSTATPSPTSASASASPRSRPGTSRSSSPGSATTTPRQSATRPSGQQEGRRPAGSSCARPATRRRVRETHPLPATGLPRFRGPRGPHPLEPCAGRGTPSAHDRVRRRRRRRVRALTATSSRRSSRRRPATCCSDCLPRRACGSPRRSRSNGGTWSSTATARTSGSAARSSRASWPTEEQARPREVPIEPRPRRDLRAHRPRASGRHDRPRLHRRSAAAHRPVEPPRANAEPAAQEAGVPWVGFHTFRHTCASMLFDRGRNIVQVQRWLGHHSPAFTLATYVHLLDDELGEPLDLPCAAPAEANMCSPVERVRIREKDAAAARRNSHPPRP